MSAELAAVDALVDLVEGQHASAVGNRKDVLLLAVAFQQDGGSLSEPELAAVGEDLLLRYALDCLTNSFRVVHEVIGDLLILVGVNLAIRDLALKVNEHQRVKLVEIAAALFVAIAELEQHRATAGAHNRQEPLKNEALWELYRLVRMALLAERV